MRITNTMLTNNMIGYLSNNLERLDKYNTQLATGKKIRVPSDDPVVATRALKLRTDVSKTEQYKKNAEDAQSWIDATEAVLSDIGEIFQRARELAVQGSNGTMEPDDREKSAKEIEQLRDQLIVLANTTYSGRYVFSGYKTDTKLLNDDGTFNIEISKNEKIKYQIGISDDIDINVTGSALFNSGKNVDSIPVQSQLIKDFDDYIIAMGTKATYTGSSPVTLTDPIPFDATGFSDIEITIDGTAYNVNFTDNSAGAADIAAMSLDEIVAEINADLSGAGVASVEDGKIRITSSSFGATSTVSVTSTTDPQHAKDLFGTAPRANDGTAFTQGTLTGSKDFNEPVFDVTGFTPPELNVKINGMTIAVNLADNTAGSSEVDPTAMTLGQLVDEINADIKEYASADESDGVIRISSATGGEDSSVILTAQDDTLIEAMFGSDPIVKMGGTDAQKATYTGGIDASAIDPSAFVSASVNVSIDGAAAVTIDLSSATSLSEAVDLINTALGTSGTASIEDGKYLKITSSTWGTGSKVQISPTTVPDDEAFMSALLGTGTAEPPTVLPGINGFSADINDIIGKLDKQMENLAVIRADIGAKTNRLDLTTNRLSNDVLNFTELMSNNEDVDTAETIMKLKNEENVYNASLSAGARIIQPSLLDFLK